jgi:hypothetical protein
MSGRARQLALFTAWGVAGASLTLIVSQIGFFTVPAGLVLVLALLRYGGNEEALGLFAGAGAVAAVIGVLNLDYHPCSDGPVVLPPGQTSYECGGFDGMPWLIVGAALMTAAVVGFALLRRS